MQRHRHKTPLFCIHPGVGEVLAFVNLARYFVNERPFHALRARSGDEGTAPFASLAEMARSCVQAIRERQPQGPYAIAGYSYGAAVALEVSKLLKAQDQRVDFVGSVHLPPHLRYRVDELDRVEGAVNLALFLSLIDPSQAQTLLPQLRAALPDQDPCVPLIDIAAPERLAELALDLPKFRHWATLAQSLLTLGRGCTPSGQARAMSIFYAVPLLGAPADPRSKPLKRWDDFIREPTRDTGRAGEPGRPMGPQHVATFQAAVRAELDFALDGH